MEGIDRYGNSWKDVSSHVGTRSPNQCCSHAQKHFMRLKKLTAEEMKKNPATKDHIFVVVKYYYNKALVQKERVLSYKLSDISRKNAREKNELDEDEEYEGSNSGGEEAERSEVRKSNNSFVKESTNRASSGGNGHIDEERERLREKGAGLPLIYYPVAYPPLQCFPMPLMYPPHYNPFPKPSQNN